MDCLWRKQSLENLETKIASVRELEWSLPLYFLKYKVFLKLVSRGVTSVWSGQCT